MSNRSLDLVELYGAPKDYTPGVTAWLNWAAWDEDWDVKELFKPPGPRVFPTERSVFGLEEYSLILKFKQEYETRLAAWGEEDKKKLKDLVDRQGLSPEDAIHTVALERLAR